MHDETSGRPATPGSGIAYPGTIRAAGILSISFGCVTLLAFVIGVIVFASGVGDAFAAIILLPVIGLGGALAGFGLKLLRGTAESPRNMGMVSILLGTVSLGIFGLLFATVSAAQVTPGFDQVILRDFGWPFLVVAGFLLPSGLLAWVGDSRYRAWRRDHQLTSPANTA